MKKLTLFLSLFLALPALAIDGTYFVPQTVKNGMVHMIMGIRIKGDTTQLINVSQSSHEILSIREVSPFLGPTPTFISDEGTSRISEKNGRNTHYCKTRYGMTQIEGDEIVVYRWSHVREVFLTCPRGKSLAQRGENNGRTDEVIHRIRLIGDEAFIRVEYPGTDMKFLGADFSNESKLKKIE